MDLFEGASQGDILFQPQAKCDKRNSCPGAMSNVKPYLKQASHIKTEIKMNLQRKFLKHPKNAICLVNLCFRIINFGKFMAV